MSNIRNDNRAAAAPPQWRIPKFYQHEDGMRLRAGQTVDWGPLLFDIPEHHRQSKGEGVKIAILDTGWPAGGHPDLPEPRIIRDYVGGDGYDRRQGHGAHVAGIICAQDNEFGSLGIAPKSIPAIYRVLGDNGSGSSDGIAKGIYEAVDDGNQILNLSLGGPYHRGTEEAIEYAAKKGVFVIVAGGNAGERGMDYPALLAGAFAVASTNRSGLVSTWSSRGNEIDLACPGERIYSTWLNGGYNTISGSSMACPFLVGCLALMLASRTDYTITVRNARELRGQMGRFVQDIGAPGHDRESGDGIPRVGDLIAAFRGNVGADSHI